MKTPKVAFLHILLLLILLLTTPAARADDSLIRMSHKTFFATTHYRDSNTNAKNTTGEAEDAWRLTLLKTNWEPITIEAVYALTLQIHDSTIPTLPAPTGTAYRLWDLDSHLQIIDETDTLRIAQNLDRAYMTWASSIGDVIVGRQAISFGSMKMFDIIDVVSPFPFDTLDKEHKRGVDAIRLRIPVGDLDEVDLAVVGNHKNDHHDVGLVYARMQTILAQWTCTFLALKFNQNALGGMTLAGNLLGAGTWMDIAAVGAGVFANRVTADDYLRIGLGADYSLADGTYILLESVFSSAGASTPEDYPNLATKTAYTSGGVTLLGRWHIAAQVTHPLSPRLTIGLQPLFNPLDGSGAIAPQLEFDAADNWSLAGGGYIQVGASQLKTDSLIPTPASEFGWRPNVIYITTRADF